MIKKYAPATFLWCIVSLLVLYHYHFPEGEVFSPSEKTLIYSLRKKESPKVVLRADEEAKRQLGKALFFDPGLSKNGKIACATCHDPQKNWTDGRQKAVGLDTISRNTLSLWNVKDSRWLYWDGRSDSRWSQALKPMEAPKEMGGSRLAIYHFINAHETYTQLYTSAFGRSPKYPGEEAFPNAGCPCTHDPSLQRSWDQLNDNEKEFINDFFSHIGKAIQAFEDQIISDSSRFDRFAEGLASGEDRMLQALDSSEIRGLKLFFVARCILCHHGPDFTDQEFHNIRLPQLSNPPDSGRLSGLQQLLQDSFNLNSRYADSHQENLTQYQEPNPQQFGAFKTPSLRNVSLTAPYMHDGRFATLREVLTYYNTLPGATPVKQGDEKLIIPLFLKEEQIQDLLNFLSSLEDPNLDFLEEE